MLLIRIALIAIFLIIAIDYIAGKKDSEKNREKTLEKNEKRADEQPHDSDMAKFAATQLIGDDRFFESYGAALSALHKDPAFMSFVRELRIELGGSEKRDTRAVNRRIANTFYYGKANERFPEVLRIVREVRQYGTQASAHISIYYAMYILDAE